MISHPRCLDIIQNVGWWGTVDWCCLCPNLLPIAWLTDIWISPPIDQEELAAFFHWLPCPLDTALQKLWIVVVVLGITLWRLALIPTCYSHRFGSCYVMINVYWIGFWCSFWENLVISHSLFDFRIMIFLFLATIVT